MEFYINYESLCKALIQAMGGEVILSDIDLMWTESFGVVQTKDGEVRTYRLAERSKGTSTPQLDLSAPASLVDGELGQRGFVPSRHGWMMHGPNSNTFVNKGPEPLLLHADSMDPNETQLLNPGDVVVIKPKKVDPGGVRKRQPGEDLYRNILRGHVTVEDYDGERTVVPPGMAYSFTEKRGYKA